MTHMNETDFQKLTRAWRSDAGPDAHEVASGIRRIQTHTRIFLIIEMLIACAGGVVGIWLLVNGDWAVGPAAIAFSVIGACASLLSRGAAFRSSFKTVTSETQSLKWRLQLAQRSGWAGLAICITAFAFLLIVAFTPQANFRSAASPIYISGVGAILLLAAITSLSSGLRAGRRLAKLRDIGETMASKKR